VGVHQPTRILAVSCRISLAVSSRKATTISPTQRGCQ
jgi:hypothetical protein